MLSPEAKAETDVRIRLTLALSSSAARGESSGGRLRGTPNPVTYLTADRRSTPYKQLPTPLEAESPEEVESVLREWERLSERTDRQLALEMTAPVELNEPHTRLNGSPSRPLRLTSSADSTDRLGSNSVGAGALVTVPNDNAKLSPYQPSPPPRPVRLFRAAMKTTVASESRRVHPKSTTESRAQLLKSALKAGPPNPYGNYAQSEATVEQRGELAHSDAESEYSDTVFGSTALSPLDYEEQSVLAEKEYADRSRLIMKAHFGFTQLHQAFYKELMDLSMAALTQSFEFDRKESQRPSENAVKHSRLREDAGSTVEFWNATCVNKIICSPSVAVPLKLDVPAFLKAPLAPVLPVESAVPLPTFLDIAAAERIRCVPLFHVSLPPLPAFGHVTPSGGSVTQAPSTPRTPSVVDNPYEKFWVEHHVEEDEMTTFAIAPPVHGETPGLAPQDINIPPPKTPPTALVDEEEYVAPPP